MVGIYLFIDIKCACLCRIKWQTERSVFTLIKWNQVYFNVIICIAIKFTLVALKRYLNGFYAK